LTYITRTGGDIISSTSAAGIDEDAANSAVASSAVV